MSRSLILGLTVVLCAVTGAVALPARAVAALPGDIGLAWGHDVGDGASNPHPAPVPLTLPGGVPLAAVSGGTHSSLALAGDGRVYAWGDNSLGALGDGTTTSHLSPAVVALPAGVVATAIAAGNSVGYAISSDGSLYAWGYGGQGDLGNGGTADRSTPGLVDLPAGVRATAVSSSGSHTTLVIGDDGNLYGWGFNGSGQIGDGTMVNHNRPVAVALPGGVLPRRVVAGNDASAAIGSDGRIYTWGSNSAGQLGNGTGEAFTTPQPITLPGGGAALDVGINLLGGIAVGTDGLVYVWGHNGFRQLGDDRPSSFSSLSPVTLSLPGGALATAVATGESNSHAVGVDGSLYGWGENSGGLVGDGTTTTRTSAVTVTLPDDAAVASISDGSFATLAVVNVTPRPPRFIAASPALVVPAGAHVTAGFVAAGHPAPSYSLAPGAPDWLGVDARSGVVSGTVPAGVTSFTFAVTATNNVGSATTLPSTVAVGQTATVSGHITASAAPVPSAAVEVCGRGVCTDTTTDAAGAYSTDAVIGSIVTITAVPPPTRTDAPRTLGPVTVPALGLTGQDISLHDLFPIADGVAFTNLPPSSPGRVWVNWSVPSPVTVHGCANGMAVVVVSGTDQSGQLAFTPTLLTETPVGSGDYTGVLPALYPMHGVAQVRSRVICLPAEGLEPAVGPAAGGGTVTLGGTGLSGAGAVRFGGIPAAFSVSDDTMIQATPPAGTGTVAVTVAPPSGPDIAVGDYTYQAVTAVTPAAGPPAGGTLVTIAGTGLGNATQVTFGGTPADFTQIDDGHLQAVSPPGAGPQDIRVETIYGTTAAGPADRFSYQDGLAAAPAAARPTLAPVRTAGAAVALPPLTPDNIVKFARSAVFSLVVAKLIKNASQAKLIAAVRAEDANKNCRTTLAVKKAAWEQDYDWVNILGGTTISYGIYTVIAADLLLGPIGLIALAALVSVVVFSYAKAAVSAVVDYAAEASSERCTGAASPSDGNLFIDPSGGVQDTNGNPVAGATVTLLRSAQQTGPFVAVPAGDPALQPSTDPETTGADGVFHWDVLSGFYEVQATAPGCADPADSGQPAVTIGPYAVPPPRTGLSIVLACANEPAPVAPTVTGLSAHAGAPGGGDAITVTGNGFTPAATVAFGSTPAPVTYLSPNLLTVVTPAGSGATDVTVHTAGGPSAISADDRYLFGGPPAVTGLSSSQGPATGGTTITITGSGFTGATTVSFGHLPADHPTIVSDNEIRAAVPPGPLGPVDVQVTSPAGTSTSTAADRFTYTGTAPAFTSPASATFTAGAGGTFTPATTGAPIPSVTEVGALPTGIVFSSGILSIAPSAAPATTHLTFIATNGVGGQVAQPFTLTINPAPTVHPPVIHVIATTTAANTATVKVTPGSGDLLVAYVAADGPTGQDQPQTATVTSNRNLTWTLVRRTNTRHGTAEIWTARAPATPIQIAVRSDLTRTTFNQQVTVVAYGSTAGIGATATANGANGAPGVALTTTAAGSWVFAVGNDWDRSVNRTPGAQQTIHAQATDSAGDTYWVQSPTAPAGSSGTAITINDTAPTNDRWNLTAIEILAAP